MPQSSATAAPASTAAVARFADPAGSGGSARRIPFKLWNNHIYIQTSVNDSPPLWFLLDTGASTFLSRRVADTFKLPLTPRGRVGGVGETTIEIWSAEDISFRFSGVEYARRRVGVIATEPIEVCANRIKADENGKITRLEKAAQGDQYQAIDGILGSDFFQTFVVEIDYDKQMIDLYDPKSYQYAGTGEIFRLEMAGIHIFVRAPLNATADKIFTDSRFLVDTGAVGALFLNTPFVDNNKLLPPPEQTKPQELCGIGGTTASQVGTIESLQLKSHRLDKPVTVFSQSGGGVLTRPDFDGIIGNAILRRFRVIFDYSRNQMILEPRKGGDK